MQTITVDMTPGFRQPTIHYSQNDVGTTFAIDLRSRFGDTLPASPTVKIQATKPSGFGFSIEADSVVGSVATFTTVDTMTDEAGRFQAELEISEDSVVLYTANFYMEGEANPHPIGTTDGSQETIIPTLTLLVERVEAAAASVLDMTVNATTLAAGSQATYSYDEDTNTATFGIPQGEAGAGAAGVTASAYSSSSTYAVGDYVIHNSNLYRCTTAITTAEAFTAAHWTQVVLGDDVSDLKSELSERTINLRNDSNILNGYLDSNNLITESANSRSLYIQVEAGEQYCIQKKTSSRFRVAFTATEPSVGASVNGYASYGGDIKKSVTVPSGNSYLILTYWTINDTDTAKQLLDSIIISKGIYPAVFIDPISANDKIIRQEYKAFKWSVGEQGGLEPGTISNVDGSEVYLDEDNSRVRTDGMIRGSYHIEVNSSYRIMRIAKYSSSGEFIEMLLNTDLATVVTSFDVKVNEEQFTRIAFATTSGIGGIFYYDDVIKAFYPLELYKVPHPLNASDEPINGTYGQLLSTNGDGSTKWVDALSNTQVAQAVTSWLDDHPEIVSVEITPESFGAVGDGATDDTTAIQDAINAVSANGGGVVRFADKSYICEGLTPKNNVTLRGMSKTVLALPSTPSNHLIYYYSDTVLNNFNLESIQFDGRAQTTYDLVHIEKISDVVTYIWDKSYIDKCWFSQARIGVLCSVPGNVKLINSILQANDKGISQRYEHFHITNTIFWANRIGADIYKANHFTWLNATFAHNTEYGVYADAGLESALIGCNFIDNVVSFYGGVLAYRFIGCRFINATSGIVKAKDRNIIEGCYFAGMSSIAIDLDNTDGYNNNISNCLFVTNDKDIEIAGNDFSICGNQFRNTQKAAIKVKGSNSMGFQINGNKIIDCSSVGLNSYSGIEIDAPYIAANMISNNIIRNTGSGKAAYAINMSATFASIDDILITNNIARNMKTSGYRLSSSVAVHTDNNLGTVTTF